jgi:rifampicin phosphotransferase
MNTQKFNPITYPEWNATQAGDFFWSNVNFGEAVTEAMTPLAFSVLEFTLQDWLFIPGYPTVGNIGGHPYLNISIFATIFGALGRKQADILKMMESTLYMRLPEGMEIPRITLSLGQILRGLGRAMKTARKQARGSNHLDHYISTNLEWFTSIRQHLQNEDQKSSLYTLWQHEIGPHVQQGAWTVLGTATNSADYTMKLRRDLNKFTGPEDANLLIANLSAQDELLDSLGPVAGIARLAAGDLSEGNYLDAYGHRGPHEFEISRPRPSEDTSWLERELQNYRASPIDVDALLAKGKAAFENAWERLEKQDANKAAKFHKRIQENSRRARQRELARSEYIRDRWLTRLFFMRVGELSSLEDDIFFLHLDEVLALLKGEVPDEERIQSRKERYQQFKKLPPYPSMIRGQFDPRQWATDPNRRSDYYDRSNTVLPDKPNSDLILGAPGSAGRVEGTARRAITPEEGAQLQPGEILVTVQTDIAWTLLFPRAAAVVTDIGAPLSHAAIVARELGIPAVVGCGNATMRLKTGDRVRVDGAAGTVEII